MQEPSYLGNIALVSIWFRNGMIQMITWVYKPLLALKYLPNIKIRITILLLRDWFFDYHAFTYVPHQTLVETLFDPMWNLHSGMSKDE